MSENNQDKLQENIRYFSKKLDVEYEFLKEIIHKSLDVKNNSYSPYSKFRVGSILVTKDNKIYQGVNIENCSYGLTNCAERSAIFQAVSLGEKIFKFITCSSDLESFLTPCGACRQVISEFNINCVLLINTNGECELSSMEFLLPKLPNIPNLKRD